jgi:hypothetical protein
MGLRAPKRLARREGLGTARERRPARPTRDALIPRPRASAGPGASPQSTASSANGEMREWPKNEFVITDEAGATVLIIPFAAPAEGD